MAITARISAHREGIGTYRIEDGYSGISTIVIHKTSATRALTYYVNTLHSAHPFAGAYVESHGIDMAITAPFVNSCTNGVHASGPHGTCDCGV